MIPLASQLIPVLQTLPSVTAVSTSLPFLLAQLGQIDPEQLAKSPWPYALSLALAVIGYQYNENGKLRDRMLEMQAKHYESRISDNKENNTIGITLAEGVRALERVTDKVTR